MADNQNQWQELRQRLLLQREELTRQRADASNAGRERAVEGFTRELEAIKTRLQSMQDPPEPSLADVTTKLADSLEDGEPEPSRRRPRPGPSDQPTQRPYIKPARFNPSAAGARSYAEAAEGGPDVNAPAPGQEGPPAPATAPPLLPQMGELHGDQAARMQQVVDAINRLMGTSVMQEQNLQNISGSLRRARTHRERQDQHANESRQEYQDRFREARDASETNRADVQATQAKYDLLNKDCDFLGRTVVEMQRQNASLDQTIANLTAKAREPRPVEDLSGKSYKMEKFSDDTGDVLTNFEDWRKRFQLWNLANNFTELQQKRNIDMYIISPASDVLIDLDMEGKTVLQVLDEVQDRLVPAKASYMAVSDFNASAQLKDEGVQRWFARLKRLHRRAYPRNNRETDPNLINQFTAGLQNPHVMQGVIRSKTSTLYEAFQAANDEVANIVRQYQLTKDFKENSAMSGLPARAKHLAGDAPDSAKERPKVFSGSGSRRQANSVDRPPKDKKADDNDNKFCSHCKRRGHATTECRKKAHEANKKKSRKVGNLNAISNEANEDSSDDDAPTASGNDLAPGY